MGKNLTKEESGFLINLIKSGNKTKRECVTALENKFHRSLRFNALEDLAKRNNLKFANPQTDAWKESEEQIIRGFLLINANWDRKVKELPTRGVLSMTKKLFRLKASGTTKETLTKQVQEEIKKGTSLKEIAKKYKIDPKYVAEFNEKENKLSKESSIEFENLKRWEDKNIEEVFDLIEEAQKKLKGLDSEQSTADITIKTKNKYIAIAFISDLHIENVNTNTYQMRKDFKIIKETKDFYMGFGGDLADEFLMGPHKEGANEAVVPLKAVRVVAGKIFDNIKEKVLYTIIGCHDDWAKSYADYNLVEHISRKIKVPYLGYGGDINLKLNNLEYFIHARHKYRGSSGLNNGTGCCKNILRDIDSKFDIISIGHNHFAEIKLEYYLRKLRVFIRNGSYKVEDRFSKSLGYQNNTFNIQIPVAILNTNTKEMKIVSGISNAADMLNALNRK